MRTHPTQNIAGLLSLLALPVLLAPRTATASSHMDAPLITLDPAANTTDVYAFVAQQPGGAKVLEVSLGVYPFEEPGVGPNKYNFDDNVLYQIIVSTGADVAAGNDTIAYQFKFTTTYQTQGTILQSYVGVVNTDGDSGQNLVQRYTVTKVVGGTSTLLGSGIVPPNNQGLATPHYNLAENGNLPAKPGVTSAAQLDVYTSGAIAQLSNGYRSWAGQREDGFYGDINAVFDLLNLRTGSTNSFDSQSGYNIHTIALEIPVSELGGDQQVVGVYATTSRQQMSVLSSGAGSAGPALSGGWVQVARQGNPLFNEALVALKDKDLYSRTKPSTDASLFQQYASTPELAAHSAVSSSTCFMSTGSDTRPRTQDPSHGAGQRRPVSSGKLLVARRRSLASANRPVRTRSFHSGIKLPKGQPSWQKAMPQFMQRAACSVSSSRPKGR